MLVTKNMLGAVLFFFAFLCGEQTVHGFFAAEFRSAAQRFFSCLRERLAGSSGEPGPRSEAQREIRPAFPAGQDLAVPSEREWSFLNSASLNAAAGSATAEYPESFQCPILHTLMEFPVIAADGITYEVSSQ